MIYIDITKSAKETVFTTLTNFTSNSELTIADLTNTMTDNPNGFANSTAITLSIATANSFSTAVLAVNSNFSSAPTLSGSELVTFA